MTHGSDHREPDSAFDRLRQADPARTTEPDLVALRRATDARITDPAFTGIDRPEQEHTPQDATPRGDARPGGASPADIDPDDGAAAGVQRRTPRSAWTVAAAVAAMLAVGAGGYVAGSQRDTPMVFSGGAADAEETAEAPQADSAVPQDADGDSPGRESSDQDLAGAPRPMDADGTEHGADLAGAVPLQFIDAGLPTEARQGDAWIIATDDDDAEPVLLGQYPVIPAADAVARLGDPRFAAHLRHRPAPGDGAGPPPAPSEPGAPLAWPVHEVRLVGAELTVGAYTHGDQDAWMLPTWVLTDDQGQTWSVLAVTDDALDFTAH